MHSKDIKRTVAQFKSADSAILNKIQITAACCGYCALVRVLLAVLQC